MVIIHSEHGISCPNTCFREATQKKALLDSSMRGAQHVGTRPRGSPSPWGGSLEAYYWCYGETDFMCIMDIPESAKADQTRTNRRGFRHLQRKAHPSNHCLMDEMDEFTLPGQLTPTSPSPSLQEGRYSGS